MNQKLNYRVFLMLCAVVSASCTGGGNEHKSGVVMVSFGLQCAISIDRQGIGFSEIPANCAVTPVQEGIYQTDQSVIHLSGHTFAPESNNCSNPSFGGPPCFPAVPSSYSLAWNNLANGFSGTGSVGYNTIGTIPALGANYFIISTINGPIGWNTYDPATEGTSGGPAGISLEMGPNIIQIFAEHSNTSGNTEITVTRTNDLTPPTVDSVLPEPGGNFGFRIVVSFNEQPDPTNIDAVLEVTDRDGQPVIGTSLFAPNSLTLAWRPDAPLLPESNYTARVSSVIDMAGNTMVDDYVWSFTTR